MAKIGRPTKMTENVILKLEQAFLWGCSDSEACVFAGIGASTLYDYCKQHSAFSERKELLKNMPKVKAKSIIYSALEDGDLATANKVIDRAEGTKVKTELTASVKQTNRFTDMSDEELNMRIAELEGKLSIEQISH